MHGWTACPVALTKTIGEGDDRQYFLLLAGTPTAALVLSFLWLEGPPAAGLRGDLLLPAIGGIVIWSDREQTHEIPIPMCCSAA